MNPYLELARPKTLPLALSVILLGNALAFWRGEARWAVFLLEVLTALSLQILSNIANDYGDGVRGTDAHRQGPRRMLQSGLISAPVLRRLIVFFAAFSLGCGILTIAIAGRSMAQSLTIFALGVLAIVAAITYTVGRRAYGYYALGEVSVFLFFGWLGVLGSYALQSTPLPADIFLPASGAGFLAASVLHVNNLRDLDSDARAGRKTVAIHLGFARARIFHLCLLGAGLACYALFALFFAPASALWLLFAPWIVKHGNAVRRLSDARHAGGELKHIVLINLAVAVLFSLGLLIHKYIAASPKNGMGFLF